MKPRQRRTRRNDAHAAELGPDDGLDPRDFVKRGNPAPSRRSLDHKALQLCRQVAEALNLLLSGECRDETLQGLQVVAAAPDPSAAQIRVTLAPAPASLPAAPAQVRLALQSTAGWLRTEVAAAVQRRKAPRLIFDYFPSQCDD